MHVYYVGCFEDGADGSLLDALEQWRRDPDRDVTVQTATTAEELKGHLEALPEFDVVMVGGHGHESLSGFWVHDETVRWQDLAFLLRGRLPAKTTFVFYSCDGGYPGIMHIFGREGGPDYVFGPFITVRAPAMTHAAMEIIGWKERGAGDAVAARGLVDTINAWAKGKYSDTYDQNFLRVMWTEGSRGRYPEKPGPDKPQGDVIPLRSWGL
jgi:hypothetical protein